MVVQQGSVLADDVTHVLYAWQRGGIEILLQRADRGLAAEPLAVDAPSWLSRVLDRPAGAGELRGRPRSGFGARIPEPSHG